MAQELSITAALISREQSKNLNLILEIDGFEEIFGAVDVQKIAKYGDNIFYGDPGLVYGGTTEDENSRPYINIKGTTKRIVTQLEPDKESNSSVSRVNITLNDQNQELSRIFSPGERVPDILAREANFYVGFKEGAHPRDSLKIFNGVISTINFGAGNCQITLSHPTEFLRQTLFSVFDTNLDGAINDSVTTVTLNSTAGLISPANNVRSYVQIDDEIIEYTGISGNDLTGCVRGSRNTLAASHDDDADVQSRYSIEDNSIDICLKLMLSGAGVFETEDVESFVFINASTSFNNAIAFSNDNIEDEFGLVVGDLWTTTGASEGANNTTGTITGFGTFSGGSYILTDATFVQETASDATVDFQSQYDVYPTGAGMNPKQVDVQGITDLDSTFSTDFFDFDDFLKEEIVLKDYLEKRICFPSGLFITPRRAKVSLTYIAPGVGSNDTQVVSGSNTQKLENIKISRSTGRDFYNTITWKYDEDSIEDKFLRGNVTINNTSLNRIPVGNKSLTIEAPGIRDSVGNQNKIERISNRYLQRYKFGAETFDVTVDFATGFNIDVGDVVEVTGENMFLTDTEEGSREFRPKLYLVKNRDYGITSGDFKLSLIDSIYSSDGRVGIISPASKVDSGATVSRVPLKISFGTPENGLERVKWERYIGERVKFRSPDFASEVIGTIDGFDSVNQNVMLIRTPLSTAPLEDWIAEPPDYDNSSTQLDARYKNVNCFFNPNVDVVTGTSTSFDVDSGDVAKFIVGAFVEVHDADYSNTAERTVTDITGDTITVDSDFGFTPDSTFSVDLIGFADGLKPYRYF